MYDIVREAHRSCLSLLRPGVSLRTLQHESVRVIAEGIHRLGLVSGRGLDSLPKILGSGAHRRFYPHSLGHWLGMDTHDVPLITADQPVLPGVTLTVEPGLYIPDAPEFGPYAGIGVRLEDDVLVTADGAEVLSAGLPIEAEEVEEFIERVRT